MIISHSNNCSSSFFCSLLEYETLFSQRARLPLPGPAPLRRRARSRWDALRHLTQQRLHHGGAFRVVSPGLEGSQCSGVRRGSYPPAELLSRPSAARPRPLSRCQPISSCQVCCSRSQCRLCLSSAAWEPSLNRSAPSVCSSSLIGKKRQRPLPPPSVIAADRIFK